MAIIDEQRKAHVLSVKTQSIVEIQDWIGSSSDLTWQLESTCSDEILVGINGTQLSLYIYQQSTWKGSKALKVKIPCMVLEEGNTPLVFRSDEIITFSSTGEVDSIPFPGMKPVNASELSVLYQAEAAQLEYFCALATIGKNFGICFLN